MSSFVSEKPSPALGASPVRDRRHEHRRLLQTKAQLTVLDGPLANTVHEIMTRDLSLSGVSFLLRQSLAIGQNCKLEMPGPLNSVTAHLCEITRSRLLSNGRYEMGAQFRKPL